MLLPILILIVRLTIFAISATIAFVLGAIVTYIATPISIITLPLSLILIPPLIATKLYTIAFNWFDSIPTPGWLPGQKYLNWRKQQRKQEKDNYLFKKWVKNPSSFHEGLLSLVVAFVSSLLAFGFLFLVFIYANENGLSPSKVTVIRFTQIYFLTAVVLYGIASLISWKINQSRFLKQSQKSSNLPTKQIPQSKQLPKPTNSSNNVDQELNRLKQKVQNEDGYLSQSKPEPEDKKKETLNVDRQTICSTSVIR